MSRPVTTYPCRTCGRGFVSESLAKHEPICAKQTKKKRKVFNSMKQRLTDTGVSVQQAERSLKRPDPALRPRGGGWRREHQEFIQAIRAAKMMTIAEKTGKPLPASFYQQQVPSAPRDDLTLCPHCGRRFKDAAAERHIPFCKQQHERVDGRADKQQRPAARTQFKPPPPPVQKTAPAPPPPPSSYGSSAYNAGGGSYAANYAATRSDAPMRSSVSRAPAPSTAPTAPQSRTVTSTQPVGRTNYNNSSSRSPASRPNGTPNSNSSSGYGKATPAAVSTSTSLSQSLQSKLARGPSNTPSNAAAPRYNAPPPPANASSVRRAAAPPTQTSAPRKPAAQASGRFCHECGSSFTTPQMKFCMDCGAKRISIA